MMGLWLLATIIHPSTNTQPCIHTQTHHRHTCPRAMCQELLINLFSRQPCYLGPWFKVGECTRWDLKLNHLLHSPTPVPDSQPSPFTKHYFQEHSATTICHLAWKWCVCQWTAAYVFMPQMCVCMSMCDCPSVLSGLYMCINACECML